MGVNEASRTKNWYTLWTSSATNLILLASAWIVLLFALSPLLGIPWASLGDFNFRTLMYYHAIMLPLVGILICIVSLLMNVGGDVKRLLQYSLIPAIVLAGIGSLFIYSISDTVPLWMQIFGFLVLDEMAASLIYGLLVMPRAQGIPYTKMGIGYIVVTTSVISAFLAAIVGHAAGVGVDWGFGWLPLVPGYISGLGVTGSDFTANLIGSHSHEMLPAVMGGIAALTMIYFGYKTAEGFRHWLADIGLWIMEIGVLAMSAAYIYSAVTDWSIPVMFASGPGGVNGLALDDILTGFVGGGALIGLVAIAFIPAERHEAKNKVLSARDPLRISMLLSWVVAFIAIAGIGYPIEFNETYFGGGVPPPNGAVGYLHDLAFIRSHLLLGFFLMPITAGILLAVDVVYRKASTAGYPHYVPPFAIVGMMLALIGEYIWVEYLNSIIFFVGFGILIFALFLAALYLYTVRHQSDLPWEHGTVNAPAQKVEGRLDPHKPMD